MCSAPNVYIFVYILIGTHMVPLTAFIFNLVLSVFVLMSEEKSLQSSSVHKYN